VPLLIFVQISFNMSKVLWPVLAFLSGVVLPVQAGLNSRLGKTIESPVHAALISFFVGLVGLIGYILVTGQSANLANIKSLPWPVWLGGILGAFYIAITIYALPRIGPAYTFGLIVAGQMLTSVVLDHFTMTGTPINFWKVLGICLIVAGVFLVRKF
jgi:bacterial/archaeal transporter family-2 protein